MVAISTSLDESKKEVRIDKIVALVKKIVKIGPADPEIIWLKLTKEEEINIGIARSAGLPSGLTGCFIALKRQHHFRFRPITLVSISCKLTIFFH